MLSPLQQKLINISNLTSKLLRKNFGRGPEFCQAYLKYRYLVFYLKGFVSPMEAVLLENGNRDNLQISRNIVMETVLSQLRGILELEFEEEVKDFYHDWNYVKNSGMITVVFERDVLPVEEDDREGFPERLALIHEVNRVSSIVQKTPESTFVYQISPKIIVLVRMGVLIPLEKALISKGFSKTLLVTMEDLTKSYFDREGRFEAVFKQPIDDIFVDWNLSKDNSLVCLVLK
ncbi:Na-translocating system protein MpsC family protein [Ammoniphilus sp. YIM 78166]|uniref:Na-translocating system protein MpsC family protein n=1 Tax=Ammoniphilus sp. YIM 78166 TaxID=1644106 RepID=UPI00107052F8|nr:Na-translocating system protein MpsC family protein [Ammoniphilus sp. YIM 78166]